MKRTTIQRSNCAAARSGQLTQALLTAMLATVASFSSAATFDDFSATSETEGDVYIYRKSALYGFLQSYDVGVDGAKVGELSNGSFLHLRLKPGVHVVGVAPGGFAKESFGYVEVHAGQANSFQYDANTGLLANPFYVGSSIVPREGAQAKGDMTGMKNGDSQDRRPIPVIAEPVMATIEADASTKLDDLSALPGASDETKAKYSQWLASPKPRAFVLDAIGGADATSGERAPRGESANPLLRALASCRKRVTTQCITYAIDDRIVFPIAGKSGAMGNSSATSAPTPSGTPESK